jgi:hypothetical protein
MEMLTVERGAKAWRKQEVRDDVARKIRVAKIRVPRVIGLTVYHNLDPSPA